MAGRKKLALLLLAAAVCLLAFAGISRARAGRRIEVTHAGYLVSPDGVATDRVQVTAEGRLKRRLFREQEFSGTFQIEGSALARDGDGEAYALLIDGRGLLELVRFSDGQLHSELLGMLFTEDFSELVLRLLPGTEGEGSHLCAPAASPEQAVAMVPPLPQQSS